MTDEASKLARQCAETAFAETDRMKEYEITHVARAIEPILRAALAAKDAEIERLREDIANRPLSVEQARKRNVCRICEQRPTMPLILDYGKEYACQKCLQPQGESDAG